MTEPSQYFKGRTVQEQMNEVIGYVDARAEEVAAAKADDVLEPAEQAKNDAIAAKEAAEDAQVAAEQAVTDAAAVLANAVKKTGESSQNIAGDIVVAGNLTGGTVTVPTPVNNTDAANKKYVDDADALKISITDINNYAVGLTGNQSKAGVMTFLDRVVSTIMYPFRIASYGYSGWVKAINLGVVSSGVQEKVTVFTSSYRAPNQYAELWISNNSTPQIVATMCKGNSTANASPANYGVMVEDGNVILYVKKNSSDMAITVNVEYKVSYGNYVNPNIIDISEQVADPTSNPNFVVATKLIDG